MVCTTTGLIGTLQASGGVTAPSAPQNYGTLCSGGSAVFRDFSFTIDPGLPCGSAVTVSLVMADGATNYGTLTYTFITGNLGPSYKENFACSSAPALPPGWTTSFSGSGLAVGTSATSPDTAPNDAFLTEHGSNGLSELTSPTIAIAAGEASRLIFRDSLTLSRPLTVCCLEDQDPMAEHFRISLTQGGPLSLAATTRRLIPIRVTRCTVAWLGLDCPAGLILSQIHHHHCHATGSGFRTQHPIKVAARIGQFLYWRSRHQSRIAHRHHIHRQTSLWWQHSRGCFRCIAQDARRCWNI